MSYRSGNIVHADPAAQLITQVEGTLDDHTGQWEFVETVTISTVDYRVWKNRGSGVTNPNSWGADFYMILWRLNATSIGMKMFESWDATNKKTIRPVMGRNVTSTPNANFSFGDETNGYVASDTTTVTYTVFSSLSTTGLDYFVRASKDNLYIMVKQGTSDLCMSGGVFETLLTTSPSEPFALYILSEGGNFNGSYGGVTSRNPTVTASQTNNFVVRTISAAGQANNGSLSPTMGGPGAPTSVDKLHNNSWFIGRPLLVHAGGSNDGGLYGYYRGQVYDAIVLASGGNTTRNGDTVTISGDVYVKAYGQNGSNYQWVKRDAV